MANKTIRKMLTVLLSSAILATAIPAEHLPWIEKAVTVQAANEINGHKYIAESSAYRLYVNEEDLSVVVEDKKTGAYMESSISYDDGKNNATWLASMKSAVVITMINKNDDTKQADLLNDVVTKTISYTSNGFKAELFWKQYDFGLTLEVSITDEGLVAKVADESIIEKGDQYYIGTIALYPYMGNSYLDEKEGYILVPDGNGALINLNDKEGRYKSGFSAMIYGSDIGFDESDTTTLLDGKYNTIADSEHIIAPIYGIAHTDDEIAYIAVVEDGEARATIECIPNGVSADYNRAFAKFILRKTYTQPTSNNSTAGSLHIYESGRSHSDLKVRFMFLSGDQANYSGMANAYRDYLIRNGLLNVQDSSYRTRVDFLGAERENWVFGTTSVVMTTTKDIYDIYDDLSAAGVGNLLTVYKGWQNGGLYSLPIDKYSVASNVGGGKLTNLIKDAQARGIEFYLYDDALRINPDVKNATFNVVKKINKRRFEEKTYKDVYSTLLYIIPARSNLMLSNLVTSCNSKGVGNLAVAGISNTLFSYNYSGNNYTRFETQDTYKALLDQTNANANLILEQPSAYLWCDTGAFLDMPLYTSSYVFEDESIPFLSMVLKGVMPVYSEYVNFEANKKEFFLKLVESGTYPSFYITKQSSAELIYTNSSDIYSSEYSSYKATITQYDAELRELNSKVAGATISNHEILGNGVTVVTYSNGIKVYVNYGSSEAKVDGITIGAMSYEVGK